MITDPSERLIKNPVWREVTHVRFRDIDFKIPEWQQKGVVQQVG